MKRRPTVSVDFDGVIHSYTTKWIAPHVIPDPPVPGALEWLRRMTSSFEVVILSTRCRTWRGRRAIRRWLWQHDTGGLCSFAQWDDLEALGRVRASYKKLPAWVYVDDRAWRFEGDNFPTVREIHAAKPWHKRGATS